MTPTPESTDAATRAAEEIRTRSGDIIGFGAMLPIDTLAAIIRRHMAPPVAPESQEGTVEVSRREWSEFQALRANAHRAAERDALKAENARLRDEVNAFWCHLVKVLSYFEIAEVFHAAKRQAGGAEIESAKRFLDSRSALDNDPPASPAS